MAQVPSFEVAGARIDAVTLDRTVAILESWIRERRREYLVMLGAHGIVEMQSDPDLRRIDNAAGLVTPDGMPNVWLGRWKGFRNIEKVYAPDVMHAAFVRGVALGWRHFFYGGQEGVADALSEKMRTRYPGLEVVGTCCPPFRLLTDAEALETAREIDSRRPDLVWVGLGCPKQDRWMARFRPLLEAPVLLGVGAGFDFLSDTLPLAPRWIQRSGFEWLFRLLSDPRRLWPRYSRVLPRFALIFLGELLHPHRPASSGRAPT
jgi:N-acetylglucosaminyldiphosphoundecaprenol N-acetyl-beta-D-mannosaminyltransferase